MKNFKPVIGLEVHVELKTKSKMFCQCPADYFGKEPNSHVCPVCLGLPGALPVPNKKAIEWTILISKALNCKINTVSKFDRKHYFYPDLPKGYQISQYDEPIASNGFLKFTKVEAGHPTGVQARIHRVHLEEDTGKLIHSGSETLVDFNRSGVPLVEIVTEPDFDNSDDVKAFLIKLHNIIRDLDVSNANMEEGSMRLEPNISVRKADQTQLPSYKVEVKNINSFNFVKKAIDYEVTRHIELLEQGKIPAQETRGYVEKTNSTISQRSKEEAHDYRYFPEPDIPPFKFDLNYIDSIKVPELAGDREKRLRANPYFLDLSLARTISLTGNATIYFETVFEKAKDSSLQKPDVASTTAKLMIHKKLLDMYPDPEKGAQVVMTSLKPKQTDLDELKLAIEKVITSNPKPIEDYKKGKENAIMFLVGQVMREMKGKADAKIVIAEIKSQISK